MGGEDKTEEIPSRAVRTPYPATSNPGGKKTTKSVVIGVVFNPQHSAEVSAERRRLFGRREGKINTIGNSKSLEGEGEREAPRASLKCTSPSFFISF